MLRVQKPTPSLGLLDATVRHGEPMSAQKAVCVIGWPAGHSRSPLIHNYWIKQHKIDAEYRKEAVPPEERATAVGAANCLWYAGDVLRSTNTDVEGFLGNLDSSAPGWDRGLENAIVLGAGGGARAVVFGLLSRGAGKVTVINRTEERVKALQKKFGARV